MAYNFKASTRLSIITFESTTANFAPGSSGSDDFDYGNGYKNKNQSNPSGEDDEDDSEVQYYKVQEKKKKPRRYIASFIEERK